ncbi:MAG: Helix-turn-helix domain [Gaiellaceae bacterium]|jgi:excisionase family DNA binding protein|nr:Helix-turn-helix domain [Gaiellaceae bacterium]
MTRQMEPLMTAKDVAQLLAVPESWVREATRDGRLPHLALGRYRRYQQTAIEAWLADQTRNGSRRNGDLRSRRT